MVQFDLSPIESLIRSQKKLPKQVKLRFSAWMDFVAFNGIFEAQKAKRFRDHALSGSRKGQRSVYLDKKWRVIYTLHGKKILIIRVEEITPHDYRIK